MRIQMELESHNKDPVNIYKYGCTSLLINGGFSLIKYRPPDLIYTPASCS
jgi:hypothetical protein